MARLRHPAVQRVITGLIADRAAASCVTLDLEAGFSSRNLAEMKKITQSRRTRFINLPITEPIAERAREVQTLLARKGLQRSAGPIDLLTAAVAEHHGAIVIHYDEDFEHIASVTRQSHVWVAPRGSID